MAHLKFWKFSSLKWNPSCLGCIHCYMHMMWTFLHYFLTKTTTSHHYQGNVWYTVEKRSSWAALWTNWFNMSAFPKTWKYNGLAKMRSSGFPLPFHWFTTKTNHNLKFSTLVSFNSTWAYLLRTGGTIAVWWNEKPKAFKHSDLLLSKNCQNLWLQFTLIVFVLFGRFWWDSRFFRGRHPKKKD